MEVGEGEVAPSTLQVVVEIAMGGEDEAGACMAVWRETEIVFVFFSNDAKNFLGKKPKMPKVFGVFFFTTTVQSILLYYSPS